jgi:hypothetical protein
LIQALLRAKQLIERNVELRSTDALQYFLKNKITSQSFSNSALSLENFALLDDDDVFASIKMWQHHDDKILSTLCRWLINRNLFAIQLQSKPFDDVVIENKKADVKLYYNLSDEEVNYFFVEGNFTNTAYHPVKDKISISFKDGSIQDVAQASEQLNMEALASHADKYFMAWPKEMNV